MKKAQITTALTAPMLLCLISPAAQATSGPTEMPRTVKGLVFHDENDNGRQDKGEKPLPGVKVVIRAESPMPLGLTVTDDTGRFETVYLPPHTFKSGSAKSEGKITAVVLNENGDVVSKSSVKKKEHLVSVPDPKKIPTLPSMTRPGTPDTDLASDNQAQTEQVVSEDEETSSSTAIAVGAAGAGILLAAAGWVWRKRRYTSQH